MRKYPVENAFVKSDIIFRRKSEPRRIDDGNHACGHLVRLLHVIWEVMPLLRLVIFIDEAAGVFLRNLAFDVPFRRGKQIL